MKKQAVKKRRTAGILCICLAALLIMTFTGPRKVEADAVTDTLTVAVGYWGMDLSDYVPAGTWHWSELEASLPIYEIAYTYYQSGAGTDYSAIIDSARGFLVEDILDYANIYFGDIYNLQFYVNDHNGIQAAFDRDSLFCQRYYFDDFPFHLEKIRDESGNLIGYGYDEVWQNAYPVPPMLALEDSWVAFSQEFETIGPNFEAMSSSNRFRLLFGQTSPTETLTSASAKYVSCVYVTLWGSPVFGEMPELDNSLGAHEVTMQVQVSDQSLKDALSQYMQMASTNENVMRITGLTYSPVEGYSDLVNVTVSYEIIGEGNASLAAGYGGSTGMVEVSQPVEVVNEEPEIEPVPGSDVPDLPDTEGGSGEEGSPAAEAPAAEAPAAEAPAAEAPAAEAPAAEAPAAEAPAEEAKSSEEAAPSRTEEKPIMEEAESGETSVSPETAENSRDAETSGQDKPETSVNAPDISAADEQREIPKADETDKEPVRPEETVETASVPELNQSELLEEAEEEAEILDELSDTMTAEVLEDASKTAEILRQKDAVAAEGFRLSRQKAQFLKEEPKDNTIGVAAEPVPEAADITQVKINDTSDIKAEEQRRILLWTGVVSGAICLAGAGTEVLVFKKRLK